jgi:phage gp29-like protein
VKFRLPSFLASKSGPVVSASRVELRMMAAWSPLESLTPRTLAAALNAYKGGDLAAFARLWEDARLRDDTIPTVEPKRLKAVSRLDWEVVSREDSPAAARQKDILEAFYRSLRYTEALDEDASGGFSALLRGMLRAVGAGWSVQEIVWRPSPDGLSAEFRQVPLDLFERRTGKLRYLPSEGAYNGVELEEGGWLVSSHPDRLGVASLVLYLYKHLPLRDWLVYCHRYVVPGLHGQTPARKGTQEWDDLRDALANFGQDWALLTGSDATVKTIDANAKGELPYEKIVERCDRRLTALWRGGDLGTISSADATGASLQQAETDLLTNDDARWAEEVLAERVSRYVLRYTLGDVPALAEIRIATTNPFVERDLKVDAALVGWGVPVSVSDLLSRYGRPTPEAGEALAKPAAGAPAAMANAGGQEPRRDAVMEALAADLQPLRDRLAAALRLPDGQMEAALESLAANAAGLYAEIDARGNAPAAMARRLAQAFADGVEHFKEDQEA